MGKQCADRYATGEVMKSILFAILLLFSLVSPGFAEQSVLLVTNEYMPYVNTSAKEKGFISEVVLAAFKEVGVNARIEYRPWRRCAMMVEDGKAFGAFPYGVTQKRMKYAMFSDQIWECRNVFFYLKGRLGKYDFYGLDPLRRFGIAGTSGHFYEEIFTKAGLRVDYAPGEASGIRKIWEMRSDLFAEDELVGWTLISRIFPNYKHMFASTPTSWNVNPQHIMVSKAYPGSKELMEKFNAGLKAVRENGTYDAILDKYQKNFPQAVRRE